MAVSLLFLTIAAVAQAPVPKAETARALASASVTIIAAEEIAFDHHDRPSRRRDARSQKTTFRSDGERMLIEFF